MNSNFHISEYLNYYIELEKTPGFAVLIRGNWGSGKTYFIKEFLKEKEHLYISLNGVSNVSEIENSIYQQLHPLLSSKAMKITGQVLKGILKTAIRLDLDGDKLNETTVTGPSLENFPTININKMDDHIIVFDDLERCLLPIKSTLGYVNDFVEHHKLKVIILADEEKGGLKTKKYGKVKEKVIGKSFSFTPEIEEALKEFIKSTFQKTELISEHKKTILKVFDRANYENLRQLRNGVIHLDKFLNYFPEKELSNEDFVSSLIEIFLSIHFEIGGGDIIENDINKLFRRSGFEEKEDRLKPLKGKHGCFETYNQTLNSQIYESFFKFGFVKAEELTKALKESKYFRTTQIEDWEKFRKDSELDDINYTSLESKLLIRLENKEVESIEELVNLTDSFLYYVENKICSKSSEEIIALALANVKAMSLKGIMQKEPDSRTLDTLNGRFEFKSGKNSSLLEVISEIRKQVEEGKKSILDEYLKELQAKLNSNFREFNDQLVHSNYPETTAKKFFDVPVFIYFNREKLKTQILNLKGAEINDFGHLIKNRYKLFLNDLREDKECLEYLYQEIEKHCESDNSSVTNLNFQRYLLPHLKVVLDKMNQP